MSSVHEATVTSAEAALLLKVTTRAVARAIADGRLIAADKLPGRTGSYLIALDEVRRYDRERARVPNRAVS